MSRRRRIPSQQELRTLAQAKIDAGDWLEYFNVPLGVVVHIKRALIRRFAAAAKIGEMDATPAIAELIPLHRPRLDKLTIGQSEALLRKPLKATWHILVNDGVYWISDEEFWPYF